jgi:hypothetical protein
MALLSYTTDKACVKGKGLDDPTHNMICSLTIKAKWKQVGISKKLNISIFDGFARQLTTIFKVSRYPDDTVRCQGISTTHIQGLGPSNSTIFHSIITQYSIYLELCNIEIWAFFFYINKQTAHSG